MSTTTALVSEESAEARSATAYDALLQRLSRLSVDKHTDPFTEIDWDAPEMQIQLDDRRFELNPEDALAKTAWYRSQPPEVRSRIGVHMAATKMKIGLEFESVLKRGLLEFAGGLPNGSSEFRYVYHEVIEEAQHALMFQEFVNRTGLPVPGMPRTLSWASRRIVTLGRTFPSLFFLFVLGGEDPIDYVQRRELRSGRDLHPLLERIERIHVSEEARHLSFARHYLKRNVPELSWFRRQRLALSVPFILGTMAAQMLRPAPHIVKTYGIPRSALDEAYKNNAESREFLAQSLRKVTDLCTELRLMNPVSKMLWRLNGLQPDVMA